MAEFTLRLYPVGVFLAVWFFFMMLLNGIITVSATKFDPETDKVWRFYNTFNPCVMWDHAPADMVAFITATVYMSVDIVYLGIVYCVFFTTRSFVLILFGGAMLFFLAVLSAQFLNIFALDVYREGYTSGELTPSEIETVVTHTSWYSYWLVGQFVTMYLQYYLLDTFIYANSLSDKWWIGPGTPRWIRFSFAFWMVILFSGVGRMLVTTFDWTLQFHRTRGEQPVLLAICNWMTDYFKANAWYWAPSVFMKMVVGRKLGVKVVVKEEKDGGHEGLGVIDPEALIARAHQMLVLLFLLTYLFVDPEMAKDKHSLPFIIGFQIYPFQFAFAPAWLFYMVIMGLALAATLLRDSFRAARRASHLDPYFSTETQSRLRKAHAVLWLLSMAMAMLLLRPSFNGLGVVLFFWALGVPTWILLNVGIGRHHWAFAIVWIGLSIGSVFEPWIALFNLLAMADFTFFVDETQDIRRGRPRKRPYAQTAFGRAIVDAYPHSVLGPLIGQKAIGQLTYSDAHLVLRVGREVTRCWDIGSRRHGMSVAPWAPGWGGG
eukprot:g58453.t1